MKATVTAFPWLNARRQPSETATKTAAYPFRSTIDILEIRGGWGRTKDGWVYMRWATVTSDVPKPPIVPADVPVTLYRVMTADVRPDIGWIGKPYGTFDNVPFVTPKPTRYEKVGGFNFTSQQWMKIRGYNDNNMLKINWLISHEGRTDMPVSENNGVFRFHTPEVSGGALVNVLDVTTLGNRRYAKIQAWPNFCPLPDALPLHLMFTWHAMYRDGREYIPREGVNFPIIAAADYAYIPFSWTVKL